MFFELFLKECKQILKSFAYYLFIFCIIVFYCSQSPEMSLEEKPQVNQESYGIKDSNEPTVIIKCAAQTLTREYAKNKYATYPIGFLKVVVLNNNDQKRMEVILKDITSPTIAYEKFLQLMEEADNLIGGSSYYSEKMLKSNAWVEMTYDEALQAYNEVVVKDKFSGAYARIFCDYLGYVLAIFPVFVVVSFCLRDKRAKMQELIYARKTSSIKIITSRYTALVAMMIIPILILGLLLTIYFMIYGLKVGIVVDNLAFTKYILGWLLPTILVTTAVGLTLTILTDTPIAILVQGLWWFIDSNAGLKVMGGGYNNLLIPRHNTIGNYEIFKDNFWILVYNRVGYTILALFLVVLTILVYDNKRKGRLDIYGKIFSNRKSKPKD